MFLGLCLIHEAFRNGVAVVDQAVGVVFDRVLFILRQALVVRYIKMCLIQGLLGTSLPDMWPKDVAACSKHQMSAGVVCLQLGASVLINNARDTSANDVGIFTLRWDLTVDLMEDYSTNLDAVSNVEELIEACNLDDSGIVLLTT